MGASARRSAAIPCTACSAALSGPEFLRSIATPTASQQPGHVPRRRGAQHLLGSKEAPVAILCGRRPVMRDYAKISPQFWIGSTGRKLRDAGPEATLVALYLLSNPHANMLGLYYLPQLYIAHETGLGIEGASKGLRRTIEAGFCDYDEAS